VGLLVHDYTEGKPIFLRLVYLHPSSTPEDEEKSTLEIADVLRAAQAEAASWAFKKVMLWNPSPRTLTTCNLVLGNEKEAEVRVWTEGSIPCLRWKGRNGKEGVEKGLEWVALEKYSWC
jgi:hypothetical protein